MIRLFTFTRMQYGNIRLALYALSLFHETLYRYSSVRLKRLTQGNVVEIESCFFLPIYP